MRWTRTRACTSEAPSITPIPPLTITTYACWLTSMKATQLYGVPLDALYTDPRLHE